MDTIVGNTIYRQQGNIKYVIKDNKIIEKSVLKVLPAITKESFNKSTSEDKINLISNPNLAVIDLETYRDLDNQMSYVYAAGIKRNKHPSKTFYIDKTSLNSNSVIYDLLDELFKPEYKDYAIYCHNLGNYDSIFIIKAILDYNALHPDHFKINAFLRDSSVLKLTISKKDENGKTVRVVFRVSYPILTDKLSNLTQK